MTRLFCQHCGGDPARGSQLKFVEWTNRPQPVECPHEEGGRHKRQLFLTDLATAGKCVVQGHYESGWHATPFGVVFDCWRASEPKGATFRWDLGHLSDSHGFLYCAGRQFAVESLEETVVWVRAKPGRAYDAKAEQLDATARAVRAVQAHGIPWFAAIRQHGAGVALPRWLIG